MEALLIKKFSGTAARIAWPMLKQGDEDTQGCTDKTELQNPAKKPPTDVRGGSRDDQQRLL